MAHAGTAGVVDAQDFGGTQGTVVNLNLVDQAVERPVQIALLPDREPRTGVSDVAGPARARYRLWLAIEVDDAGLRKIRNWTSGIAWHMLGRTQTL